MLDLEDLGKWERLGFRGSAMSEDGKWLIYSVSRNNKKNELRLHNISKGSVKILKNGSNQIFSKDSKWLGYLVSPKKSAKKALRFKKKPDQKSFELINLISGKTSLVKNISSFSFSNNGKLLVLKPYSKGKSKSSDIIVKNLETKKDSIFGNVKEYKWSDKGALLATIVDTKGKLGNGVKLFDGKTSVTLDSKKTTYRKLTWRKDSYDLAVFRSQEKKEFTKPTNEILIWKNASIPNPVLKRFDSLKSDSFPKRMRILDKKSLRWSLDGDSIFFSIDTRKKSDKKHGKDSKKTKNKKEEEKEKKTKKPEIPALEIWNSRDVRTIPEQKRQANNNSFLSVWHLDKNKFVQLETKRIRNLRFQPDSNVLLAFDNTKYEFDGMFGRPSDDIFSVNIDTGKRNKLLTDVIYVNSVNSGGRSFVYLKNDNFHLYSFSDGKDTNLTQNLDASFVNLEDDHPVKQKRPYGFVGWDKSGSYFIVHSKFDIWKFDSKTLQGEKLTNGKRDQIVNRYVRVDRSNRYVDLSKSVYVRQFGKWNKKSGYAKLIKGKTLKSIYWGDSLVSRLTIAKNADVAAFSNEKYDDSSDFFVSQGGTANLKQISKINPFEGNFKKGKSELIEYTNANGRKLQGSLYYPDDYSPGKKYPMITYIYELQSDRFHSYVTPSKNNYYNTRIFTAKGFFVLKPDIVFDIGDPGVSSVKTLEIAIKTVVDKGLVDAKKIGLVGHSWGGYQTAFAVTRTNIFAAAVAGAGISNLITMYGSITPSFGNTFESRHFEVSQERMQVPPWKDINGYLRNSAIPNIHKMQTPLLMEVGDADTNVNWRQGIEMYNAARRAKKEMVLLVYAKEGHGLRKDKNRIDYQKRILEWFEHYLKGNPAKPWIKDNISYSEQQELLKKRKLE